MIDIATFVGRLHALTREYQSGFDSQEEMNAYINQSQIELQNYLLSMYEINSRAVSYLQPFVVSTSINTDDKGYAFIDHDVNQILRMSYDHHGERIAVRYLQTNGLDSVYKIPQRKPNVNHGIMYYMLENGGLKVYPSFSSEDALTMVYCKYPLQAHISYTYHETPDEIVKVVDRENSADLQWGERCMNLLLYMVLDKKGLSVREHLFTEYAQLGISRERVQVNN